jgi:hypothetical protein
MEYGASCFKSLEGHTSAAAQTPPGQAPGRHLLKSSSAIFLNIVLSLWFLRKKRTASTGRPSTDIDAAAHTPDVTVKRHQDLGHFFGPALRAGQLAVFLVHPPEQFDFMAAMAAAV